MREAVAKGPTTHGTVREILDEPSRGAFARYRELTMSGTGVLRFLLYELVSFVVFPLPGAIGYALRRKLLKPFFGACGRGVIIGRSCIFRHPNRIRLGDAVTIDDYCLIDARGCGSAGLSIGSRTIVSRGCTVKSKAGEIKIGARVNIGTGTQIVSHSGIYIHDDVAIAGGCHLTGGTFHLSEFSKQPAERHPMSTGPIEIGAGSWLATGVIVLDGVAIGEGAVVSAGSVVTHEVESRTVVQGNPAKKVFAIR